MKQYKAIGFDFSGVIGGYRNADLDVMGESARILDLDKEILSNTYFSMNYLVNTGLKTWEEFLPLMLEKLGRLDKLAEMKALHARVGEAQADIDPQMLALVDSLKSRGFKVGLLTNNTRQTGALLRSLGLSVHFDVFMVSAEVGIQKPDPTVFELFAKQLGVELSELIFIDDAPRSLSAGSVCGFTPVLFKSHAQLLAELTKLKVL